jgi:hypothetical protein
VEVKPPKKSMEEKEQKAFPTIQFALKAMNAKCGAGTSPNPMALEKTMEKQMLMLMENDATIKRFTFNRKVKKRSPTKQVKAHIPPQKAKAITKSKGLVPWIGRK